MKGLKISKLRLLYRIPYPNFYFLLLQNSGYKKTNAEKDFAPYADILHQVVNKALANHTPFIDELHQSDLTPIQKKAMIIVVYFTGLEGTISQMGGLLWHLAQHPHYQTELLQKTLAPVTGEEKQYPFTARLIKESFRIHPSTLTIDRPAGSPLMVDYQYKDAKEMVYIPKKSILAFYQPWAAEDCENPQKFDPHRRDPVEIYPFGLGTHKCVGQFITEEIIGRFTREFNRRYQFSSAEPTLDVQGYFNFEPKKDVMLEIKPHA